MIGTALDRMSEILGDILIQEDAAEFHLIRMDDNTDRLVAFMEAADQ